MTKAHPRDNRAEAPQAEALARSQVFLDYQRAFTEGTGLPLSLHSPEMTRLVNYPNNRDNPFCRLMAQTGRMCTSCYALQQELEREARPGMKTLKCFAGLCESAVPVRVGESVIAFLHTGQVLLHPIRRSQFNRVARRLLKLGVEIDLTSVEEAYFQTRVLRRKQYESLVRLLTIFAQHLGACANEMLMRPREREPVAVTKARHFITNYHAEEISLARVAQAANISANYFSKRFKEIAGMTFVDYLGRVRVEKAKSLLQNPVLRISSIALDVGFQSLSQFNRTFKKVTGHSPKELRRRNGVH